MSLAPSHGVLHYVMDREWSVGGVRLRPGCTTYAVYWPDRPYNVYWWLEPGGRTLGYYFNVADSVSLTPEAFCWRDLCVDVIVPLDEAELPSDLDPGLRRYIEQARDAILADATLLTGEARSLAERAAAGG